MSHADDKGLSRANNKPGQNVNEPAPGGPVAAPTPGKKPNITNKSGSKYNSRIIEGAEPKRLTPKQASTFKAANPPANPAAPVAPFLTPAQQDALIKYDASYGYKWGSLDRTAKTATYNTNAALAAAQKAHDLNTETANNNAAARGLFQSSIRDGDLNDIDASLAMRTNILNTSLRTTLLDNASAFGRLGTDYATTHHTSDVNAVANAQAQTPVLPPTDPGTLPAAQTAAANQAAQTSGIVHGTPESGIVHGNSDMASEAKQRSRTASSNKQGALTYGTQYKQTPTKINAPPKALAA